MRSLYTEVIIPSAISHVYSILTDLENYSKWNPLIIQAKGKLEIGEKLLIHIRPPGQRQRPYQVTILELNPPNEFIWLGHMKFPGILDGKHIFQLTPISAFQTKLIHREEFSGLLVPLVWGIFLNTHMRAGFEELNLALKNFVSNGR